MASVDPRTEEMPLGHFTMEQMYGLKINDHHLFSP